MLLLGGTRFMGRYAIDALVQAGHDVWVFNRGSRPGPDHPRTRSIIGDRDRLADHEGLPSLGLDAVIDFSCYTPHQAANAVAALPDVPKYVFISTGAVYEPRAVLPWAESTPLGPWLLWGRYAVDKLAAERVLLEARGGLTGLSTVILRLPYVLGPGNYADREEFIFNRLLDGSELLIPGDGTAVQQVVSARAAAAAAVHSLDPAISGAFNVANPDECVSLIGLVALCAQLAERDPLVRHVGGGPTGTGHDVFDPANAVFPFPAVNYVLDVRAAQRAGLLAATRPASETLAESFEYLVSHPERRVWSRTAAEREALERPC